MAITGILPLWPGSIGTRGTFRKCPVGYTRGIDCQRSRGGKLPPAVARKTPGISGWKSSRKSLLVESVSRIDKGWKEEKSLTRLT
jgi:hypothetical protein